MEPRLSVTQLTVPCKMIRNLDKRDHVIASNQNVFEFAYVAHIAWNSSKFVWSGFSFFSNSIRFVDSRFFFNKQYRLICAYSFVFMNKQ